MASPGKSPTPKGERACPEMEGVEFGPCASSAPPSSGRMEVDPPSQQTPTPPFADLTADGSPVAQHRVTRQVQASGNSPAISGSGGAYGMATSLSSILGAGMSHPALNRQGGRGAGSLPAQYTEPSPQASVAGADTTTAGTLDLKTRVTLIEEGQRRHNDTITAITMQISAMSNSINGSEEARRKDEEERKQQRENDRKQRKRERRQDNDANERRHSEIYALLNTGISLISQNMAGGAQIPTVNPSHIPPPNIALLAAGSSTVGGSPHVYRAYSAGTSPRPAFDNHRNRDGRRKRQRRTRPWKAPAPTSSTSTGTANPIAPRGPSFLPYRTPPFSEAACGTRVGNPADRAYSSASTQTQHPPSPRPPSAPGSSTGNPPGLAVEPPSPRTPAPNGA